MSEWLVKAATAQTVEKQTKYLQRFQRDRLTEKVRRCRGCDLNRTRTHAVPLSGAYEGLELLIVGEAPGKLEDERGEPFIGRAGQLLRKTLKMVGGDEDKTAYMNVLACRPPKNRDPRFDEVAACRGWFEKQIEMTGVLVGVTVGAYPLRAVNPTAPNIGKALNKPFWRGGKVWVPTYHPAYILRNPLKREVLVEGLKTALMIARGEVPLPKIELGQVSRDLRLREIEQAVVKQGWAMLYLEEIGGQIVIVGGGTAPAALKGLPHYTLDEAVRLGILGVGRKLERRHLQGVNRIKEHLEGVVVA